MMPTMSMHERLRHLHLLQASDGCDFGSLSVEVADA
jgi:hypothetical protein